MFKMSLIKLVVILIILPLSEISVQAAEEINLNFGWRFAKGEQPGAYDKEFDDSQWRIVDIPHD